MQKELGADLFLAGTAPIEQAGRTLWTFSGWRALFSSLGARSPSPLLSEREGFLGDGERDRCLPLGGGAGRSPSCERLRLGGTGRSSSKAAALRGGAGRSSSS